MNKQTKNRLQIHKYRDLVVARWEGNEELGKMGEGGQEMQAARYGLN